MKLYKFLGKPYRKQRQSKILVLQRESCAMSSQGNCRQGIDHHQSVLMFPGLVECKLRNINIDNAGHNVCSLP